MSHWQRVFADKQEYRTEIVFAVLQDSGMQPVRVNKKDAAYQMGMFEIHVPADDVIRAIKIIKDDIRFS